MVWNWISRIRLCEDVQARTVMVKDSEPLSSPFQSRLDAFRVTISGWKEDLHKFLNNSIAGVMKKFCAGKILKWFLLEPVGHYSVECF
jgi:hypothetical protein